MGMLRFEFKKLWKQKKLLWLSLIVLICTTVLFIHYYSEQQYRQTRALDEIEAINNELQLIENNFHMSTDHPFQLADHPGPTEQQLEQMEHVKEMKVAAVHWRRAIEQEDWISVPVHKGELLAEVERFTDLGGEFQHLQGIAREKEIQKTAWLIDHGLPYEDESYPLSPILFGKDNAELVFGLFGVLLLLILFGNTITVEKERNTWATLKTQPMLTWERMSGKYVSLLMVIGIFIITSLLFAFCIPLLFGHTSIHWLYPQIVDIGKTFTIIPVYHYILRILLFFICASILAFSIALLLSTWMKDVFIGLLYTFFILTIGTVITHLTTTLQTIWNPFYFFQLNQLINNIHFYPDWLYVIVAFAWSILLLMTAVLLPEKDMALFQKSYESTPFHSGKTKKAMSPFRYIRLFEWRKLWRKGLLIQSCFVLILLIACGYFIVYNQSTQTKDLYIEQLTNNVVEIEEKGIPFIKERIELYEELAEESDDYYDIENMKHHAKRFKESIRDLEDQSESIKKAIEAVTSSEVTDWTAFHEYQLYENRATNHEFMEEGSYAIGSLKDYIGQFTVDASIAEKHWLIEHNIQPVFAGEFIPTIHHYWGDQVIEQQEWEAENLKVDHSGLFSLYMYFDGLFYLIPLILFLFLLGGGFASERGKKPTIQMLKTQPLTERHIFTGKIINAGWITLISTGAITSLIILIGTVFNRLGDWMYPILHYDPKVVAQSDDYAGTLSDHFGFHFIPIGEYLLKSIGLLLLVGLFLTVFMIVMSLFFNYELSVFGSAGVIVAVGYLVSRYVLTESAHLSPFTYLHIPKIINGEIATVLNNPTINFQTGSIVLSITTFILFMIGYVLLNESKINH